MLGGVGDNKIMGNDKMARLLGNGADVTDIDKLLGTKKETDEQKKEVKKKKQKKKQLKKQISEPQEVSFEEKMKNMLS